MKRSTDKAVKEKYTDAKEKGIHISERTQGVLMMGIPFVCVLIFVFLPFAMIVYMSLFSYQAYNEPVFGGLTNYIKVFEEASGFWNSSLNSLLYAAAKLVFEIPLSLFAAYTLANGIKFGKGFRLLYFAPYVFSEAVVGLMFNFIFSHQFGPVNIALSDLGAEAVMWFSDRFTSLLTVTIASTWQFLGLNTIYFLTGFAGIDAEIYKAAAIDGAGYFTRLTRIALPAIKPAFVVVTLNSILGSMTCTDIFLTLNSGSPAGQAESILTYIYKSFFGISSNGIVDYGYVSAMSVVASLIFTIVALCYLRFAAGKGGYNGS